MNLHPWQARVTRVEAELEHAAEFARAFGSQARQHQDSCETRAC